MNTRTATFAGRFYPRQREELVQMIEKACRAEELNFMHGLDGVDVIGGIIPHAGYTYSAYQAVHFYEILRQSTQTIETAVITNPNHTGRGSGHFNTCGYDMWETPLGKMSVDFEFGDALGITSNHQAHINEHSGEVQLPMLQYFLAETPRIVIITMNRQNEENANILAGLIHQAQKKTQRKIVVIASSDFSHFESPVEGYRKDQLVIDEILKLNSQGIYRNVKEHQISTCGYGPVMTLIEYAKLVERSPKITILRRGHSGEIFPSSEVVDYVSMVCYK